MAQNPGTPMVQVEMQQCIQDCLDCNTACLLTASNYQLAGGGQANPDYIFMLQDCAELCMTTAHFMQHDSPLHGFICQTCALVCNHAAAYVTRRATQIALMPVVTVPGPANRWLS